MKITMEFAGTHTTVQDLGRPGHRHAGVPVGGAVDRLSLRVANLLVGNPEGAAALECAFMGSRVRFSQRRVAALYGAQVAEIPYGRPFEVGRGEVVDLRGMRGGNYAYLAVCGGLATPEVMGSRSMDSRIAWGGLNGRPLAAGDVLPLFVRRDAATRPGWGVLPGAFSTAGPEVRFLRGPHFAEFAGPTAFRIGARLDRMGVMLEGTPLHRKGEEPASRVVAPGTIQVPPSGQPVVLLADAGTLGGYPILGHVIGADLGKLVQMRPGAEVRLREVALEEAHRSLQVQEGRLGMLAVAVRDKLRT